MSKRLPAIWICLFLSLGMYAQPSKKPGTAVASSDYASGMLWVKLKPAYRNMLLPGTGARTVPALSQVKAQPLTHPKSTAKSIARMGPRVQRVDIALFYQLSFDATTPVETKMAELYNTGYFELIEPVYTERPLLTPNDPSQNQQYYLDLINAYEAWDITPGDPSIVIAIVDTGGDLNHPDLQSQLYIDPKEPLDGIDNDGDGYKDNNRGWDFSGDIAANVGTPGFVGDNDPSIPKGGLFMHGTMVAGCAAAATDNNEGIAGVGFNSKLMFTKHYSDDQPENSQSYSSNLYQGVLYAAEHGARIINTSWGGGSYSAIAQQIIEYVTIDLQCLVVAAAGNSNVESPLYPASYNYVLSVASSDQNDVRSTFSNFGKDVDISAPGTAIYTTTFDNAYGTDQGTSFSAPLVAGAAALVWSLHPTYTPLQVAEQLRVSADESLYDNNPLYLHKLGKGRLDVARALTYRSPSIRASKQLLITANGSTPEPGSTANLFFDFTNYLETSSSGLAVTLSSSSPYLTITQNTVPLGTIPENSTVRNTATPFVVTLAANAPLDQPIEALLTYTDGAYNDYQLVSFVLPSYIDVNENNIITTLTSSGRLGFSNTQSQSGGSGFRYNEESLLYEMGIIMGTSASVLYNNVRGASGQFENDFTADTKIVKHTPGERSYSEVTGSFRNAPTADASTVNVTYRSLVWQNDPYKDFVIVEYKIKNTSPDPITGFYMGIFADWDIVANGANDRAGWNNATRLGYVYPAQVSNLPSVGIQVLTGSPKYYAIDNDQAIAGNPFGIYDAFTDAEKFQTISSALVKTQAGTATTGGDVSHVAASGPYNIAVGQEITLAFALHASGNTPDLITSSKYADSVYNYTLKATMPLADDEEICYGTTATLHATGATKFKWYKDFLGGTALYTGADFTTGKLYNDTVFYVSNAAKSFESRRTPVHVRLKSNPVIQTSRSPHLCEGESVTLSVNEADEYTWSIGAKTQSITVTTAGLYSVVVRDNVLNCTSPDIITVTVKPKPSAAFTITQLGSDVGFSPDKPVTFTPTLQPNTEYYWNFGDNNTSEETLPEHTYAELGHYTIVLTVTAPNLCQSVSQREIDVITGVEESQLSRLAIHPNPATTDVVQVKNIKPEAVSMVLYTAQGQVIAPSLTEVQPGEYLMDVSRLANGVYIVYAISGTTQFIRKIVVAR